MPLMETMMSPKNGGLEIAEAYHQFPKKSSPKKPSLGIDMHYLGLLVRKEVWV